MENEIAKFSVSDFLAVVNQSLEFAFGLVEVEGEVSSFRVNHQKYVFFDIKDDTGVVGCFMTVWQLRGAIEDGMKVVVKAVPKVTAWGKFSLTVSEFRPVGEGSIKRASELLRQKLEKEGLFSAGRKRILPKIPQKIAVISSVQSAGYKDFLKILTERWGGLDMEIANVQVQGEKSPNQIIQALEHFNSLEDLPEVIVIVRGGGSAEYLDVFNDEVLVRAIASSRVPTLVGIGHEVDETLSDLVADLRASTPTHAAQILVPDKQETLRLLSEHIKIVLTELMFKKQRKVQEINEKSQICLDHICRQVYDLRNRLKLAESVIYQLNPRTVLRRGYALIWDEKGDKLLSPKLGQVVKIEMENYNIKAEVKNVESKNI